MTPQISIIVPVYNADKWLNRCIDSILGQTFTDFELLLVDDGSKDGSGVICDAYAEADSRVRVFHKPNGGVSSARNLGIDNANGEWIAFCDADDYVLSDWLDNFDFISNANEDIICQGIVWIRPGKEKWKSETEITFNFDGNIGDMVSVLDKMDIFGYLFNKAYRGDILSSKSASNIRFNTELNFMEDEDFNLRYLHLCKRGLIINKASYCYILSDAIEKYGMFSFNRISQYKNLINITRELYGYKGGSLEHKYQHFITSSYIRTCIEEKFNSSSMRCFRSYLISEFKFSPLFFLTKFFIICDPTGIISRFALNLHIKLKTLH